MDVSRLPIRTVASGKIMSMGVLIASSGTQGRRVMTRNCEVMAHQYAWGFESVKYHELISQRAAQDYTAHQFLQHFKRHSTMNESQIKDVLFSPSDRWLTPQECLKFGLVDILIDELPALNESVPVSQVARQPSRRKPKIDQQKMR
jgi:ATP-dependent protease ClpP protease subunit